VGSNFITQKSLPPECADLGPAVTVDVADADRSTGVRQTGAVEIRLQRMTRDWRQMLPMRGAKRGGFEFHHPEIVAA
jgi:hypothetical protein